MKQLLHSKAGYLNNNSLKVNHINPHLKRTIRIMKLTGIVIIMAMLHVSAASVAQKISISKDKESLKQVLKELKKKTGYLFLYSNQVIEKARPVTIHASDTELATVLKEIFDEQPLSYEIQEKTILVKDKEVSEAPSKVTSQPRAERIITGMVIDENENPLPGVTVIMKKDHRVGTATDVNGHFALRVVDVKDMIQFRMIGFNTQEYYIPTDPNFSFRVKMVPAVGGLNEVQVIGYGTTTRRLNTGAVSSITSKDIAKQTIDNPLTALQGHIAGVQITQDNGLPGGGVRIQIRGQGSTQAGTIPLYVIDGVPFTLFNGGQPASDALNAFGTSGANGNLSPFSTINPQDIERIDVLKDADATAIYGSRGANGVVLITTKKGRAGKTVFNANVYSGYSEVNHFIPMMNTQQYLAMRKQAFANSGVTPTNANAPDLTVWDQNAYTDWQKYLIGGKGHTTEATASVSGGSAQNTFLFSSTYRHESTVFGNNYGANNFSNRLNAGHQSADKKFNLNMSVNYSYLTNNEPTTDLSTLYSLAPNYPLYNADGSLNFTSTNPISIYRRQYTSTTTNLLTNMLVSYELFQGFNVKANLGYSLTGLNQANTNPASAQNIATNATIATVNAANKLTYANNNNSNYIIEPQAEYQRKIGAGKLDVLAGTTFQNTKATGITINGSNFASELLLNNIANAGTVTTGYGNYSLYKYTAVFGRINYNWEDKYILDGTIRRDGSSRFGPDHRFGTFGAIGAAWLFTNESWMKDQEILSFGKLRGSYGITGNDQIPNYLYTGLYSTLYSGYSYQGTSTLQAYNISNPNLHWETNKKLDVALEVGFFKDRITLKADYYRNRSGDQLLNVPLPDQSGYSGYTGNFPAVVQNKGFEFELNTTNINAASFRWTTSFNIAFNRNKLISFPGLATSSYASTYIIGQPITVIQAYHYTGVNPQTGLPTFQDQNGDGAITYANDRIPLPVGNPFFGGLTNSITYKGFNIDFTFQFNHRNGYINNTLAQNFYPYGYAITNQSTDILNRWMQSGDIAKYPAAGVNYSQAYSNLYSSDYNWGDASFIKFKTLSLSYSLPKNMIRSARITAVNVFLQGQNLYTWAKQKYNYDPEVIPAGAGGGLGNGQYITFPQLRTIVLGVNFTL